MPIILIDHAATEAAIAESRAYSSFLAGCANDIRNIMLRIRSEWQGAAFDDFAAQAQTIWQKLDHYNATSFAAADRLVAGQDDAREAERRAEEEELRRREEEERRSREPKPFPNPGPLH